MTLTLTLRQAQGERFKAHRAISLVAVRACFVRRDLGSVTYRVKTGIGKHWRFPSEPSGAPHNTQEDSMNSIIYIVGLVVIIGVILSYFGFR